jgi:hypothetical protein
MPSTNLSVVAYPNPAMNHLNVRIESSTSTTIRGEVYSMNGQKVLDITPRNLDANNAQVITVSLASMENGYYILRIIDGETVTVKAISVNK